MSTVISTRQAEFALLEFVRPGEAPVTIGVLLHDSTARRLGFRLRRDWDRIADEDERELLELLADDLRARIASESPEEFLARLEDTLSNSLRITDRRPTFGAAFEATLQRLYNEHVQPTVLPFRTHLPVYSLKAAAGGWSEGQQVDARDWMETPEDLRLSEDLFIAQVTGRSMLPLIPDGAWCVFRRNVVGSREGKLVLVENFTESAEGLNRYTVKRYHSVKRSTADGSWEHDRIRLEPLNSREFEPWELEPGQIRVLGEFVRVLEV